MVACCTHYAPNCAAALESKSSQIYSFPKLFSSYLYYEQHRERAEETKNEIRHGLRWKKLLVRVEHLKTLSLLAQFTYFRPSYAVQFDTRVVWQLHPFLHAILVHST